jgi:hypothetical protein
MQVQGGQAAHRAHDHRQIEHLVSQLQAGKQASVSAALRAALGPSRRHLPLPHTLERVIHIIDALHAAGEARAACFFFFF